MSTPEHPVALVTGASRGIGRAVAQRLARRGVRVALHYGANRSAAEETLAGLTGSGHALFQADLTGAATAPSLVATVLEAFGQIDLLINNAGIFEEHPIARHDLDFAGWAACWERTLAANLVAPAHLSFLAARSMQGRKAGGRIVNISSRGAFRGEPRAPAYGASKAGLNAMGQSLAKALAPERIFVFTLAPGWVATDMAADHLAGADGEKIVQDIPLGRVAEPGEIAEAAAWLALDAPPSMTGCIIDLNGASYLRT